MSTASRIISGTISSWLRIFFIFLNQITLVPIYISTWGVGNYGIWLAIQAVISILSTFDNGHLEFLGNKFLQSGKSKSYEIATNLWAGFKICIIIGVIELITIIFLIVTNSLNFLIDEKFSFEAEIILIVFCFISIINGTLGGLLIRALSAFGYYPRLNWWGVLHSIIIFIIPIIAILFNADFFLTTLLLAISIFIYNLFLYQDMIKLIKKENIWYCKTSLKIGWNNFIRSLILSAKSLLENARQQGIRIILAPLAGMTGLVAFTTMRTGANVALQGLSTITNPLMPELMNFLNKKDQLRAEISFGTVWLILVAFLAPAVVIIQTVIEPLFLIWTREEIVFNPYLFALLSMDVLVFAAAQPAFAIIIGNNLLKEQLTLSLIAALTVIAGLLFFIPKIGIISAGIVLLIAQIQSAGFSVFLAKKWLRKNDMKWPKKTANKAFFAILISGTSMFLLNEIPKYKWFILFIAIILFIWNLTQFWNNLPSLAKERVNQLITNFFLFNKQKKRNG